MKMRSRSIEDIYEEVLEQFAAAKGGRWGLAPTVGRWAVAAGRDSEQLIGDLGAKMDLTREHVYNLKRCHDYWVVHYDGDRGRHRPLSRMMHRLPATQSVRHERTVRAFIEAGGARRPPEEVMLRSPTPVADMTPRAQSSAFFRLLWRGDDLLFVTAKGADVGRPGANMRPADEWAKTVETGRALPGEIVTPNPLSGRGVSRTGGDGREYTSYICADCLEARRPYAVMEFDDLELEVQAAFWMGFLLKSPLSVKLVSLVYSGSRSIHGLLATDADTGEGWESRSRALQKIFASDPDAAYRADLSPLKNPLTKTRIAGATRRDTGMLQRLLYFNPKAAEGYVMPT